MTAKTSRNNRGMVADACRPLLNNILAAVHDVEPDAEIILYGSRARGDAAPDSDWDLLILLDGSVSHQRAAVVRHRLYDLEFAEKDCPVLSALVYSKQEWNSPLYLAMPFHRSVDRDGKDL